MAHLILNSAIFLTAIIYSVTGSLIHLGDIEGKSYYEGYSQFSNWTAAYSYCLQNGMRLAKVESSNQSDFLSNTLNEAEDYWVSGVHRTENAHQYSWNNQGVNSTFHVTWTNSSADVGWNDDCAILFAAKVGVGFVYIRCHNPIGFMVCEDEANSTQTVIPNVTRHRMPKLHTKILKNKQGMVHQKLNFTYLGDVEDKSFYLQDSQIASWAEAYQFCQEANMSLARIESEVQASFLYEKLEDAHLIDDYWIGLKLNDMYADDVTFNMTGGFLNTAYGWATNGSVEDDMWAKCGSFSKHFYANKPIPSFPSCFVDNRFICHVNI